MSLKLTYQGSLNDLECFVQKFLQTVPNGAIVGLSGELGSGKTTLVRAIIKAIAKKNKQLIDRVISPSFVLHQSYENLNPPVHHFDLYRMESVTEAMLVELEYYEILENVRFKKGFLFVEWPEMCVDPKILGLDATIAIKIIQESRSYEIEVLQ